MVEALFTRETKGMQTFHERSLAGEYGGVFRTASALGESFAEQGVSKTIGEAGSYWSEYGIWGGLRNWWNEVF